MTLDQYILAIEKAAGLIRSARHAVAFTGAGISTPSGIPDFRSAQTGLWVKDDPMEVASLTSFLYTPDRFFNWLRPLARTSLAARPNSAHMALADLEKGGFLKAVITQNIDDLHFRAGSQNIFELHGSLHSLSCQGCHQTFSANEFLPQFVESGIPPTCPECHVLLKPDIVLFEERLPATTWYQAEAHAHQADLMIVVGSSLTVTPAAYIPQIAVESGAKVIIINHTATFLDKIAEIRIPLDVAEVLPAIAKQVL
jgi:NAD-dependent deacetylase